MKNKEFRMTAGLYLDLGPDSWHTVRIGPLPVLKIFEFVRKTPKEIHDAGYLKGSEDEKRDSELISDALGDWNTSHRETDEGTIAFVDGGWKWFGISVLARVDGIEVWAVFDGGKSTCSVRVNEDRLDSDARRAVPATGDGRGAAARHGPVSTNDVAERAARHEEGGVR